MKSSRLALLALVLVMGSTACSSSGTTPNSRARANRNSDVVTAAELVEVNRGNLFDAVRALRPDWLRVRGRGTVGINQQTSIRVYIDNVQRGSTSLLARIRISSVREIRYLNPQQASLRYGSTHRDGAMWITLN